MSERNDFVATTTLTAEQACRLTRQEREHLSFTVSADGDAEYFIRGHTFKVFDDGTVICLEAAKRRD